MKVGLPRYLPIYQLAICSLATLFTTLGCQKVDPSADVDTPSYSSQVASTDTQPTNEECEAFANSFLTTLFSANLQKANEDIDWNAIVDRSVSGIPCKKAVVDDFRRGFLQTVKGPTGIIAQIIQQLEQGGDYRYLRTHEVDGQKRVLFRLLLANDGGVNYQDMILSKDNQGNVRAVDIYVFSSAENLSQTFRRAFIPIAAESSKSIFAKLTQSENDFVENLNKIQQMALLLRQGQYAGVDQIYRSLPESLQQDKSILLIQLQAAVRMGDKQYAQAIETFKRFHPKDPCIDMLSIDSFFMKQQFAEAFQCIARLEDSVGGDPYLNVMRANAKIQQQENNEAKAYAELALKEEPDLFPAYQVLINLSIADKDFDETVRLLTEVQDKFEIEFEDFTQVEEFSDFVKSPQYKKWIELQ